MTIYVFDLGGVLINLNVTRCMHAFEELMGEQNMRTILGMDSRGEGVKAVSVASKQLMVDFEQGLISTDSFVREVLAYCRPGTTPQQVIDAWMAMLEDLPAERLSFIDDLRSRGYKTYLLSNGNDINEAMMEKFNVSTGTSKLIGAACIVVYIMVIGAALSILVTECAKLFKK